jgi:hypothetical protein
VFKSLVKSGYLGPRLITKTETGLFYFENSINRTETGADWLVSVFIGHITGLVLPLAAQPPAYFG